MTGDKPKSEARGRRILEAALERLEPDTRARILRGARATVDEAAFDELAAIEGDCAQRLDAALERLFFVPDGEEGPEQGFRFTPHDAARIEAAADRAARGLAEAKERRIERGRKIINTLINRLEPEARARLLRGEIQRADIEAAELEESGACPAHGVICCPFSEPCANHRERKCCQCGELIPPGYGLTNAERLAMYMGQEKAERHAKHRPPSAGHWSAKASPVPEWTEEDERAWIADGPGHWNEEGAWIADGPNPDPPRPDALQGQERVDASLLDLMAQALHRVAALELIVVRLVQEMDRKTSALNYVDRPRDFLSVDLRKLLALDVDVDARAAELLRPPSSGEQKA